MQRDEIAKHAESASEALEGSGRALFRGLPSHSSAGYTGSIKVARRPASTVVCLVALMMLTSLVLFGTYAEFTRKVTVTGAIMPSEGLIQVAAVQAGTLSELYVREGQEVRTGQLLARISSARNSERGDAYALTRASLQQRRTWLEQEIRLQTRTSAARIASLKTRLNSLESERATGTDEVTGLHRRVELSDRALSRQKKLLEDGFVSMAQVQQKEEEQIEAVNRLNAGRRVVSNIERDLEAIRSDLETSETDIRTTIGQLERSIAQVDQELIENDARGALAILSPQKATVGAIAIQVGQGVRADQTVLSLVPTDASGKSELQAVMYVPTKASGFIRAGQRVLLRFNAFPYQKFGMGIGRVSAVGTTPIAPQDLPSTSAQAILAANPQRELLYRVTVSIDRPTLTIYGVDSPLKVGMTFDADVIKDRVKVWEWAFEPVIGAWVRSTPSQK